MKKTPRYKINPAVEIVEESLPVADAIKLMNDRKISSLLVKDAAGQIVGIVTERDIVRKFTLLDVADKLQRSVGVIATRNVVFADFDDLHNSLVKLHFEKGIRHFPVLKGKDPKIENIAGILTVTDVLRQFLMTDAEQEALKAEEYDQVLPLTFGVMAYKEEVFSFYERSLKSKTLAPLRIEDLGKFVTAHSSGDMPLVVDMDGWPHKSLSSVIVQAKKYKGQLILAVSDPTVVTLFRKYLEKGRQTIVHKPWDPVFLSWLLTHYATREA